MAWNRISYHNFGHIPRPELLPSLYTRLFGIPNLKKRQQARDIIGALDLQPDESVLDFGCGRGYMTIELAKLAHRAVGVDIDPRIERNLVPAALESSLQYVHVDEATEDLPFRDNEFDVALASEVIYLAQDSARFMNPLRRILRPGGRLVICQGIGDPAIRMAYENDHWFLRLLRKRFPESVPSSYDEYCLKLQGSCSPGGRAFFTDRDWDELFARHGFTLVRKRFSPNKLVGSYLSWRQFWCYVVKGKAVDHSFFLLQHAFLSLLRPFDREPYESGILLVARNDKDPG